MLLKYLSEYRCPETGSPLTLRHEEVCGEHAVSGELVSSGGRVYKIEQGVPNFIDASALSRIQSQTQVEYDNVADGIYDVAVDWQFAVMYEDEGAVRESMVDMLELKPGMQVLEVGCGTGRDSFRLARRLGSSGYLHMQDLSARMVHECVKKMELYQAEQKFTCELDYSISSGTSLPFPDGTFDAVFHFGGFNQFGDLKKGAAELTRVAKVGGRVLYGDEAVAPWLQGSEFAQIVIANNPLFDAEVPLESVPVSARDVTVKWIINGCFYIVHFVKGEGYPKLNLDLPHRGWRGGTMRSRYFGRLEGITVETKALVREAAERSGLSVHEWLDRLVKREAAKSGGGQP